MLELDTVLFRCSASGKKTLKSLESFARVSRLGSRPEKLPRTSENHGSATHRPQQLLTAFLRREPGDSISILLCEDSSATAKPSHVISFHLVYGSVPPVTLKCCKLWFERCGEFEDILMGLLCRAASADVADLRSVENLGHDAATNSADVQCFEDRASLTSVDNK